MLKNPIFILVFYLKSKKLSIFSKDAGFFIIIIDHIVGQYYIEITFNAQNFIPFFRGI